MIRSHRAPGSRSRRGILRPHTVSGCPSFGDGSRASQSVQTKRCEREDSKRFWWSSSHRFRYSSRWIERARSGRSSCDEHRWIGCTKTSCNSCRYVGRMTRTDRAANEHSRKKSAEPIGIGIAPRPLTAGAAKLGNPRGPQPPTTLAACLLRRKDTQHATGVYVFIRKHV